MRAACLQGRLPASPDQPLGFCCKTVTRAFLSRLVPLRPALIRSSIETPARPRSTTELAADSLPATQPPAAPRRYFPHKSSNKAVIGLNMRQRYEAVTYTLPSDIHDGLAGC